MPRKSHDFRYRKTAVFLRRCATRTRRCATRRRATPGKSHDFRYRKNAVFLRRCATRTRRCATGRRDARKSHDFRYRKNAVFLRRCATRREDAQLAAENRRARSLTTSATGKKRRVFTKVRNSKRRCATGKNAVFSRRCATRDEDAQLAAERCPGSLTSATGKKRRVFAKMRNSNTKVRNSPALWCRAPPACLPATGGTSIPTGGWMRRARRIEPPASEAQLDDEGAQLDTSP